MPANVLLAKETRINLLVLCLKCRGCGKAVGYLLKGTVARYFLASIFFHGYRYRYIRCKPQISGKKGFSFFSFSRFYSNISINLRCRLLRQFKISAVAYSTAHIVRRWASAI
jgi:hypothetical protein